MQQPYENPWRIMAVLKTGLLDTAPEPAFDRLAQMAAIAARAPMAFLSLVTSDRQFIKASTGMAADALLPNSFGVPPALCLQVIDSGLPFCVTDLAARPEVGEMALLVRSGARSYCGIPVADAEGRVLGTLVVLDGKPRVWTEAEVTAVGAVALSAATEIRSRRLENDIEHCNLSKEAVYESLTDGFLLLDRDWRYTYINRRAAAMTGHQSENLLGRRIWDVFPQAGPSLFHTEFSRAVEQNVPVSFEEFFAQTGQWFACRAYPGPEGLAVFYHDVTEQRSSDALRRDAERQRLEAMTRMAGAIAHDVNNLLTIVQGVSELLLAGMLSGDPLREDVAHIRQASTRTAALTQKLLSISRKQVLRQDIVDTGELLRSIAGSIVQDPSFALEIQLEPGEDLGPVVADRDRLEEVLRALIDNAREATPAGGMLVLSSERHIVRSDAARLGPGVRAGAYVVLQVRDSGSGIAGDLRERVFEPFFSTRDRGPTAGLGLSTALGIIEQSGGTITLGHVPGGQGTLVQVFLPEVQSPVPEEAAAHAPAAREPPDLPRTILLAEDEAVVRRLTKTMLELAGYRVIEAVDGREALEKYSELGHSVDLVVTDVLMPHMGGVPLAERLGTLRPELPVLFVSGYTEERIGPRLGPQRAFLQKPYDSASLVRQVRKLLDAAAPAAQAVPAPDPVA